MTFTLDGLNERGTTRSQEHLGFVPVSFWQQNFDKGWWTLVAVKIRWIDALLNNNSRKKSMICTDSLLCNTQSNFVNSVINRQDYKIWRLEVGMPLSSESPVALFSTPVANVFLCGWIISTTGNFTLEVTRNGFQHLDFDGLLCPLLITWYYNHEIKIYPSHWWTRCYHFRITLGYQSNSTTC